MYIQLKLALTTSLRVQPRMKNATCSMSCSKTEPYKITLPSGTLKGTRRSLSVEPLLPGLTSLPAATRKDSCVTSSTVHTITPTHCGYILKTLSLPIRPKYHTLLDDNIYLCIKITSPWKRNYSSGVTCSSSGLYADSTSHYPTFSTRSIHPRRNSIITMAGGFASFRMSALHVCGFDSSVSPRRHISLMFLTTSSLRSTSSTRSVAYKMRYPHMYVPTATSAASDCRARNTMPHPPDSPTSASHIIINL